MRATANYRLLREARAVLGWPSWRLRTGLRNGPADFRLPILGIWILGRIGDIGLPGGTGRRDPVRFHGRPKRPALRTSIDGAREPCPALRLGCRQDAPLNVAQGFSPARGGAPQRLATKYLRSTPGGFRQDFRVLQLLGGGRPEGPRYIMRLRLSFTSRRSGLH